MDRDVQLMNEYRYSRKHIDRYIREEIEASPETMDKVKLGVKLISEWLVGKYYESKMIRLEQVKKLNLEQVVIDIFVGVAYCQSHELFTAVTGQLAGRLQFSNKEDGIKTIAELCAVLCETDAFDIHKEHKMASLMIISKIPLHSRLVQYIRESSYLPPMVCEPMHIGANHHSGYLTHNESVILRNNHHNDPIALDVLNIQNKIPLSLNRKFLSTIEEEPTHELDTTEKLQQWNEFKKQSYDIYIKLTQQSEVMYLTNKYDKRVRMYACGYHVNTQGTPFKKAMIDFAEKEYVEGAP